MVNATKEFVESVKIQAVTFAARDAERNGVFLTWDQVDEVGDEGTAWIEGRLSLLAQDSTDRGIQYVPQKGGA
jgi:hypothetical protein